MKALINFLKIVWHWLPFNFSKSTEEVSKENIIKDRIGKALDQPSQRIYDNMQECITAAMDDQCIYFSSIHSPNNEDKNSMDICNNITDPELPLPHGYNYNIFEEMQNDPDIPDILKNSYIFSKEMVSKAGQMEEIVKIAITMARTFHPEVKGMSDEEVREFMIKEYSTMPNPSKEDSELSKGKPLNSYPLFNPYGDIMNLTGNITSNSIPEDLKHYPLTPDEMVKKNSLSMDLVEEISTEGIHTFYKEGFQSPDYWYQTLPSELFSKAVYRKASHISTRHISSDVALFEYGFLRKIGDIHCQLSYRAGLMALGEYFSTQSEELILKAYWRTPDSELNEIFKNHFKL